MNNNHTVGRLQVGHCHQVGPSPRTIPWPLPSIVSPFTYSTLTHSDPPFHAALEGATIFPLSYNIEGNANLFRRSNYFPKWKGKETRTQTLTNLNKIKLDTLLF